MTKINVYNTYSNYLQNKYGEKVYKLPIKLDLTCPNRDGNLGVGGCTFCGEEGGSFENHSKNLPIREQLKRNKSHISKKYKAKKFIPYFQNFSNTYMELSTFKKSIKEAIIDDIVAISISTRPDSIKIEHLNYLKSIEEKFNIDIIIELGLQTVNYKTLNKVNRGHTLAEFIDAVQMIKDYKFRICTHIILNLPWDDMDDVIENAKIISALKIDEVKLHSLYLMKDTKMTKQYINKEFTLIDKNEYIERVIVFLEYLDPNIVIQRLLGRAPEKDSIFVNWGISWWKIRDEIIEKMIINKIRQGDKYNYLGGKAFNK